VTVTEPSTELLPARLGGLANRLSAAGLGEVGHLITLLTAGEARGLRPLRSLLVGGISTEEIERAAWLLQGFELIDVSVDDLDLDHLDRIGAATCRRLFAVPVRSHIEGEVLVAVADPSNVVVIDDVRELFPGIEVRIAVAERDAIAGALAALEHRSQSDAFAVETPAQTADVDTVAIDSPDAGADGQIAKLVRSIIDRAAETRASDVHLEPGAEDLVVRFRIDGVLHEIATYPVASTPALINRLKVMAGLDLGERRVPQDGRFDFVAAKRPLDVRLVTLPTSWGVESATLRLLDQTRSLITLESLGFSDRQRDAYLQLAERPHGAILATGPTGSGKTTTLYATLQRLATPERKVLTVEDPVEYKLPGVTQVQVNEKAGLTFARALRSFLRADPDIILVGEMRDEETASVGTQAALTGHLVLSTLHANTAAGVPGRLIEMEVEPFLVASSLAGAIAQRLVRKLCSECREPFDAPAEVLDRYEWPDGEAPDTLYRRRAGGCSRCSRTGFRGRLAIAEVLPVDEHIAALISRRATAAEIEAAAIEGGMQTMFADGLTRVRDGLTSLEELARVVQ